MRRLSLLFFFVFSFCFFEKSYAQVGCPNCQINLPILAEDTIFNTLLADGQKGVPYSEDLSFRLPLTTTPVAAYDSTTPPNLPISKFEITDIDSLPPGLKWEASALEFDPNQQKDGCIRICGTPTQAGSFEMIVRLDVTVFIVTRPANFRVKIDILPTTLTNDGFSLTNPEGCAPLTVGLTNNHPSSNNGNYQYLWDFGDGDTSILENPQSHTYTEEGTYIIDYQALVDTAGYTLAELELLDIDCVDQLGLGNPDVFFYIKNANDSIVYDSRPAVNNIGLPYLFSVNLPLDSGGYMLEVWDDDSGLKGADDLCGSLPFNLFSQDTLTNGGLTVVVNIEHPITEVLSQDTVRVFATPPTPILTASADSVLCEGETLFLLSSSASAQQWLLNGEHIPNATNFTLQADEGGFYQVEVQSLAGCTARSDSFEVIFHPLPEVLPFLNVNNLLYLPDSADLGSNVTLQWSLNGMDLLGKNDPELCAQTTGVYAITFTDALTGCNSSFGQAVTVNPNIDCTSSTTQVLDNEAVVFPNPFSNTLHIQFEKPLSDVASVRLSNAIGQLVMEKHVSKGEVSYVFPTGNQLPEGVYVLEILSEGRSSSKMVMKL